MNTTAKQVLRCHALRLNQSETNPVYLFALSAGHLRQIADVARIARSSQGALEGYQRSIAKDHVEAIASYLNSEDPLFPNAIIIALPSSVRFEKRRGPGNDDGACVAGELIIQVPTDGAPRPGWIVDGQQRWMALEKSKNQDFPIPVAAFIADTVDLQRDQFIRINSVKPLDKGLVTELLPSVAVPISPRLSAKKLPSALVDQLNSSADSPFQHLIKRPSLDAKSKRSAVVQDTSLVNAIEESLSSANGALFPHRNLSSGEVDIDAIWWVLVTYWTAVRDTFPAAWGKPPTQSRLMHGVGIRAMGRLMDRMMNTARLDDKSLPRVLRDALGKVAKECHWTEGNWDGLSGLAWNDLENTARHTRLLSNFLVRHYLATRDQL